MPIILMGYLNPVMQYGLEMFCTDAAAAGVDGLILPDMPLDIYEREFKAFAIARGLKVIFLISPTTSEERIRQIDDASDGFIYAVSASSTTGVKGEFNSEQVAYFERIKNMKLKNPFLIGFGISGAPTFRSACTYASGAIVGSAFVSMLGKSTDMKKDTVDFVNNLRQANGQLSTE